MIGIFGNIDNPTKYGSNDDGGAGLFALLSNIFKLIGTIAGIYFIIQIISAGFGYISSNGDPKKTEAAWAKITQSLIGLVIIACAFVLAGLIGKITGIDPFTPTIYGPN